LNIIAIETSSSYGSIAIYKSNKITFIGFLDIKVTHSERLLPQIDYGLKYSDLSLNDIDLVCLGIGPGSFTGIRIGLATAKGLCFGNQIPLMVFNTLDILAHNLYRPTDSVLAMIDARMGEIYAALYDNDFNILIPPCNSKPDMIFKKINSRIIVIGDGYFKYEELLKQMRIDYLPAPVNLHIPLASTMIGMYLQNKIKVNYDFNYIADLEPNYLRKSQAELVKENKRRNNDRETELA